MVLLVSSRHVSVTRSRNAGFLPWIGFRLDSHLASLLLTSQVSLVVRWKRSPDAPSWHPSSRSPASGITSCGRRSASPRRSWSSLATASTTSPRWPTPCSPTWASPPRSATASTPASTTKSSSRRSSRRSGRLRLRLRLRRRCHRPHRAPRATRSRSRTCATSALDGSSASARRWPRPPRRHAAHHRLPATCHPLRSTCHVLSATSFVPPATHHPQAMMPLMRTRPYPQLEPANMRAPWLYEVDDLIGLVAATPHPNHSGSDGAGTQGWSLLNLQLNVPRQCRANPHALPLHQCHASPSPAPAPTSTPNEPTPSPPTPTPRSPPPPPRCQAMPSCSSATATSPLRREA